MNKKRVFSYFAGIVTVVVIFTVGYVVSSRASFIKSFNISTSKNKLPKALVVYSGSMEPAIKTASVVFSIPQESYYPGDIISFRPPTDTDNIVTHRIDFKQYPYGINSSPIYLTSGDANEDIDKWEITDEQIVGRVAFSVPFFGYAVDFAKKPYGFILLVIIPATIIIYEEVKFLKRELSKLFKKILKKENKLPDTLNDDKSIAKAYILIPTAGLILLIISTTASFFMDMESTAGNFLSAAESFEKGEAPLPPENTHTIYLNELGEDINDQYGYSHDYSSAAGNNVSFTYVSPANPRLRGTIDATGLKPYATYQVKFSGTPICFDPSGDDLANEYIGYKGRWTCPACAGDANARNRTDVQYEANKLLDDSDQTKECIVGYLVWDFFTADSFGNVSKFIETANSYHVLLCGGGVCDTINNDSLSTPDTNHLDLKFCPADKVNGEIEKFTCGGLDLDSGSYHLQMSLTEESFHQGSWAVVLVGDIDFDILP